MCTYLSSTTIQRDFALAVPLCATAWFVTAPIVPTTSDFIALVGLFLAFGWVAKTSCLISQPTSSLAQLLHDTEHSDPVDDRRGDR
jgi:hypothetical protein